MLREGSKNIQDQSSCAGHDAIHRTEQCTAGEGHQRERCNSFRDSQKNKAFQINQSLDAGMKEHNDNSHGTVTERRNETHKSVSIAGPCVHARNEKPSNAMSNKALSMNKKTGKEVLHSQEKQKKNKKSIKNQVSSVDSSYRFSNTDDSSSSKSSKNVSDGGYAGSASSNEDSNETSEQTKKMDTKETGGKCFNPSSCSSSELADFSSGTSDSGSGCSTFISSSDFSEETTEHVGSQRNQIEVKVGSNTESNRNKTETQPRSQSDASLDSSSSLRAVAPIRKHQSSKSSTSYTTHDGKEEKRVDISNSNYFVSFKNRKKNNSDKNVPNVTKKARKRATSTGLGSSKTSYSKNSVIKTKIPESRNVNAPSLKSDRAHASITLPANGEGYEIHQERLKRNYLDAFSLHENGQSNQNLLNKTDDTFNQKCSESSSSATGKKLRFVGKKNERIKLIDQGNSRNLTPIYDIGSDTMAHILSFLTHTETHSFLTTPLSKKWCETFMFPQDLWKILCVSPPFYVKVNTFRDRDSSRLTRTRSNESLASSSTSSDQSEDYLSSFPAYNELKVNHIFGIYRLLYSSFVKCVKYLDQIREDSAKGKTPRGMKSNFVPHSPNGEIIDFDGSIPVEKYLATLKSSREFRDVYDSKSDSSQTKSPTLRPNSIVEVKTKIPETILEGTSQESRSEKDQNEDKVHDSKKSKPKYSHSKLTERLLGATKHGNAGPVDLPWSCAIYSVVNWMVAFIDVLGIQIMCLEVLPCLLEDEHQRTTAQRAGLTDIVLKGMVLFPDSAELHTAAFHTLVLLARPLGGREGMLFHQTMVGDSSGILNISSASKSSCCKNGIAVMLDSMRRFHANERLQAMSCWSMVNIALIASQKTMLVKLGGISVAANAMMQHPNNAEVQFRALFALINLAIPCQIQQREPPPSGKSNSNLGEIMSDSSEKEILDESIGQISNLVVVAMKNFCSSEAIMNRACLVLHNLSLNDQYHTTLLWTPNCYQMLEWAMGNYRYDHVLQQSAGGTLQRLQRTLRNNTDLHTRFSSFIRMQQQNSLAKARREAQLLENQSKKRNTV